MKQDSNNNISELWLYWSNEKSIDTRNQIFEYYFPWCRETASKLFRKYNHYLIDWHDYLNIISLSTLKCIESYDQKMGVPFEGYAYLRVKGSVLNEIENNSKHQKNHLVTHVDVNTYEGSEDDYLYSIVDFAIEMTFAKLLESDCSGFESPDHRYEQEQTGRILINLVEKLNFSEKFVIKGHYFQQISFKDIADIMNISSARVSQLHKAGLVKLREVYEKFY